MKGYVPLSAVAKMGFHIRMLQRWCKTGKIPARRVGKKWYVHLGAMLAKYRLLTGDDATFATKTTHIG